jgi:hypothetical protein
VNAPALTVIDGEVFAVFDPSVASVAVIVLEPAVARLTVKFFVPPTRAALLGGAKFASLELIETVSVDETRFQFASTAFTVTLNDEPAVCADGDPVFPLAVPGAAVSPGTSSCSFVNAPALTVIEGEVSAVFEPSVMSVAVTVFDPAVFNVTLKFFVPPTSAAFAGSDALLSDEVMPTVSVEETRFQFASTAFTVTVNELPAVCAVGVPVLPLALPGAAVSPGTSTCSFVNAPALTVIAGEVFAVFDPSVTSVAVTVAVPAVLSVTLKFFVPPTSAAFAGSDAFASDEVMPTVSVDETRFQFASTAFTVTVKDEPAVCADGDPALPLAEPGAAVSPGTRT